jgi:hypothetical protein
MYRRASQLADVVDIAVVSQPRLFADKASISLIAGGLCMHLPGKTLVQT